MYTGRTHNDAHNDKNGVNYVVWLFTKIFLCNNCFKNNTIAVKRCDIWRENNSLLFFDGYRQIVVAHTMKNLPKIKLCEPVSASLRLTGNWAITSITINIGYKKHFHRYCSKPIETTCVFGRLKNFHRCLSEAETSFGIWLPHTTQQCASSNPLIHNTLQKC